ncbi:hypothetical protein [Neobacillus notoginsengisoli]|nr:hypothetical protein [Neobacillus notoginsengisoli]
MYINTSLSTFMKIAITAVVISAIIFGTMYEAMGSIADSMADYISKNS